MLTGFVWTTAQSVVPHELPGDVDLKALEASGLAFWLDLADPTPEEYGWLAEIFHFHPLAVEDCMHYSQRPKLEQYSDHLFMVTHMVRAVHDDAVDMPEVDIFVRDKYVVTVHRDQSVLSGVAQRCRAGSILQNGRVDFLVHAVLDTLTDSYFPALETCSDTIDALEEAIIAGSDGELAEQIAVSRRKLLTMQHRINPQVDILLRLAQRHYPFVGDDAAPYFQDVFDHATRISQLLAHSRELLGHAFEMSLAGAAHKTNDVMRRLTVVSTFFLPLTFLVGVYGMNFRFMPELYWRYGYLAIWVLMLAIAGGMWASFRRQKWL